MKFHRKVCAHLPKYSNQFPNQITLPTCLVKIRLTSNEMTIINIESNASDGEIECLRVASNRHCPVLDYLSKSLTVELE